MPAVCQNVCVRGRACVFAVLYVNMYVCEEVGVHFFLSFPRGPMPQVHPANSLAFVTVQSPPFLGIKEFGGQLLSGTRFDFK